MYTKWLQFLRSRRFWAICVTGGLGVMVAVRAGSFDPNLQDFSDPTGAVRTFSTTGSIDTTNPFFQSLGTNGRACSSCHQPGDAWTVTPPHIQDRFAATQGQDPIFRPVDGANCPSADVSTEQARKLAYSMLLNKGLIRVSLPVPANAEFEVTHVVDTHHCAETTTQQLALFRRPLPSTNLDFLATVMWDGRENAKGQTILQDLANQSNDATLGHAQAANPLTDAQRSAIVAFETALYTAQSRDNEAGSLSTDGAHGGPDALSTQSFFLGINDPLGGNPTHAPFDSNIFNVFEGWNNLSQSDPNYDARQSIARGEKLFNTLAIPITDVAGINDVLNQPVVMGFCGTCHDTPNSGNHSLSVPLNIGITDFPALTPLDTQGLPVYTLVCKATGQTFRVTDPGRAMISGKCADIGKTKGPILRGLAARAPYFHNGSGTTLMDVVNFYNRRFNLGLAEQQKLDLVAFLRSL